MDVYMSAIARPSQPNASAAPLTLSKPAPDRPPVISQWTLAWRRLQRNQLALLGLLLVLLFGGLALGADAIAPYGVRQIDFMHSEQDPTIDHFLGTDFVGRDNLTLLMFGARVSFSVAVVVPLLIMAIGVPLGMIAGFMGGRIDATLMRVTDVMFAFPSFLFMVLLTATLGRSLGVIYIALGIASWPTMARIVRGQVLQIKQADFILSARAIGTRPAGVLLRHVLPNIIGSIVVTATLTIPDAIMAEAFLTFLGIGVEATIPSWGMLINNARESIFWHPALILFPSLAISMLTLAFTFVGDGLRDALDPRMVI